MSTRPTLILGSTSRYRRELLERLHLPFEVHAPDVDETPLAGEMPAALAQRLQGETPFDAVRVGVANPAFIKNSKLIDKWNKEGLINSKTDYSVCDSAFGI